MGFDAPGNEYQVWAWIVFIVVLSIPLWFVIGAIGGWVLYLHGWLRSSLLIAGTPLAGATNRLAAAPIHIAGGAQRGMQAHRRTIR
jgi:hypothetical protein